MFDEARDLFDAAELQDLGQRFQAHRVQKKAA
jgi:hypothetical protein